MDWNVESHNEHCASAIVASDLHNGLHVMCNLLANLPIAILIDDYEHFAYISSFDYDRFS